MKPLFLRSLASLGGVPSLVLLCVAFPVGAAAPPKPPPTVAPAPQNLTLMRNGKPVQTSVDELVATINQQVQQIQELQQALQQARQDAERWQQTVQQLVSLMSGAGSTPGKPPASPKG